MTSREFRSGVLASYGAGTKEIDELLAYTENIFDLSGFAEPIKFPLTAEEHIATWQEYVIQAKNFGAFETLQKKLPQFCFPIKEGISETSAYQSATRKGLSVRDMPEASGLQLQEAEKLQLFVHQSLAGAIPVIIPGNRTDFVSIVQALTKKNEPSHVPDSMGACMIGGFNNWDRIHKYKQKWQANHPEYTEASWNVEFQRLIKQKELYQDRFIILSQGEYSNVPAEDVGLASAQWQQFSLTIRLEHECTHYFTKRLFGSMRNNLLDEFIADYRGIVAATGCYRDDWFLRFMGLESFPNYRVGARLENYRENLSDSSLEVLKSLVFHAAKNLKTFELRQTNDVSPAIMLSALCQLTLEELASDEFEAFVCQALHFIEETDIEQTGVRSWELGVGS
ncbi:MAG: hypothetical protein KME64_20185 [Scytonematopsis contorta HA4267-MV1]|jgi:hypothetical protein|nr:hypothetical protein [Scytonematopsis contorta HA4267-MV1]